jgi:hypothetical protein
MSCRQKTKELATKTKVKNSTPILRLEIKYTAKMEDEEEFLCKERHQEGCFQFERLYPEKKVQESGESMN